MVLTDPVSDRVREIFEYIAPKYHISLIEVIRQYIETQGENKSEHRVPFSDLPE